MTMSLTPETSGPTRDPSAARKRICSELAELLSTPAGLEQARLLQASGLLGQPAAGAPDGSQPSRHRKTQATPYPRPILDFAPVQTGEGLHFVRPDGARLDPRSAALPHRICLLGESTAAGMFYRPQVTPASILARRLMEIAGPGQFEVIDLAVPAQTDQGLVKVAVASLQLNPSLLVAFAGNNWVWSGLGPHLGSRAEGRLPDFQAAASAVEEQGVPGLKDLAERRTRESAVRHVDLLAKLARLAEVPLLWVVPEVNLPDVDVPHPVYWLRGDGIRSWYRTYDRALRGLERGDYEAAAREGERLIALDGGACAASQGLLAKALWRLGRSEPARARYRAQVDAGSWDHRFRRASGISTPVLAALRDSCQRLGVTRVDLPEVIDRYCGPALPDRRIFLDHCHLTLEGMEVAMAAVAAAVVGLLSDGGTGTPDGQDLAREASTAEVPAAVAGLALLQAGLYNSNLDYQDRERIEELFSTGLATCPELRFSLLDYVLARAAPCHPWLTAACRRNRASPHAFDPHVWERRDLGTDLLPMLSRLLGGHGCDVERQVVAPWIEQNKIPREGIELAAPRHWDAHGTEWGDTLPQGQSIFRAFARVSSFQFIADARQDLSLELTARLPAPGGAARFGPVVLSVNGHRQATFRLAARWRCRTLAVEQGLLHPGLNRICLRWPLPVAAGDAALAEAAKRLRLGVPAELYPVFGEVCSLKARPGVADR